MPATIRARNPLRCGLLLSSAAFAALASGGVAYAQDDSSDEIVVTGSRIARQGYISNSPISTVSAAELDLQQPVDVESVMRAMPQFLPGNGGQVNNGSSGASTLDLRGLTEPRTLALINGKRMVGFDSNALFDVTAVPVALLERVEVVTGGASAVYGSDAIAGVVNFILKDDFEGVQFDADYSVTDHGDGESDAYGITVGGNFADDRGNAVLHVGYLNRETVLQSRGPAALTPGASSTTFPVAIDSLNGPQTQFTDAGELVPFYQGFNFNPYNLYQSPQKRWGATALASYDITPNVEAYARFIYSSSTIETSLAPSGSFGFTFEVPLDNPFLTSQASTYLAANNPVAVCSEPTAGDCVTVGVRWRATGVGTRDTLFEYDTFQSLVGLRGDFMGWDWDVAAAHGENSLKQRLENDVRAERLQQSIFAASTTACIDSSNACAPINLFNPSIAISPEAANFVRLSLSNDSLTTQDYVTANITGDLGAFKSPFADSPIGASFGVDYRYEVSDFNPDLASQTCALPPGCGLGGSLPIHGHYDVWEYYAEGLIPLIENAPFADAVNLEVGYRRSDYSSSGAVESYKYGLEWQPVESLRFRAMFQRAVRAANISELFSPFLPGTGDLAADPCAEVVLTSGDLYDLCLGTGAPQVQLNGGTIDQPTAGQVNNFTSGNINLKPEEADTITIGLVAQPTFLPGLSVTLDYYDIEIADAIALRPIADVIDGCYNPARNANADVNDTDCLLIHRNTTAGNLEGNTNFGVEQNNENIGTVHTEGVDLSVQYKFDLTDWASLDIGLDATHVLDTSYQAVPGGAVIECTGHYGKQCGLPSTVSGSVGGPEPQDRWVQRTVLTVGDFDFSYRWRHLSGSTIDSGSGDVAPESGSIPDYDYIDLAAAWQMTETVRFNMNVTNVGDKEAPFVQTETGSTNFNSGNTYPSTYDVLGRVFAVGVSAKF